MAAYVTLSSYSPPTPGTGDGKPALSALINAARTSNSIALIDVSTDLLTSLVIDDAIGLRIESLPGAVLTCKSNTTWIMFRRCTDCHVDWNIAGALTSIEQYDESITGVASYFQSNLTYESVNNSGVVTTYDGSDFYHVLSGSTMTMGMMNPSNTSPIAINDFQRRRIISDFIPLSDVDRWVVDVLPGAIGGSGLAAIAYRLYDAAGTYLGNYLPSDSSGSGTYLGTGFTHMIRGAAQMKVVLETNRTYRTGTGYLGDYDLSKVIVYKVINDMATQSVTGAPSGNAHVWVRECDRVILTGNYFNMRVCAIIMMHDPATMGPGCTSCEVINAKFNQCMAGITIDNSVSCRVIGSTFDMRYKITNGNWLGNRVYRQRCVGGINSTDTTVRYNIMQGSSWAIELITYSDNRFHNIDDNIIGAEFCGVSSSFNGTVAGSVSRNKITISALGNYGIELAGGGTAQRSEAMDNDIVYLGHCSGGFGYAVSGITRTVISGGKIDAPVSCNAVRGDELVFSPAYAEWSTCILSTSIKNVSATLPATKLKFIFHSGTPTYYAAVQFNTYAGCEKFRLANSEIETMSGGAIVMAEVPSYEIDNVAITSDGKPRYTEIEMRTNSISLTGRHSRVAIVGSSSTTFASTLIGTYTGSMKWNVQDNSRNGATHNIINNASIPPSAIIGASGIRVMTALITPGTISAGGSVAITPVPTMRHLAPGDAISAFPQTPAGMPPGTVVTARITANETVELLLLNISSAAITPMATAWTVIGSKSA